MHARRGIIFFLLELNTVKVLLSHPSSSIICFYHPTYMVKLFLLQTRKTLKYPVQVKQVAYHHFQSVWQIGKQTFRRIMPCHPYPCHNHALHPEKTYFFQAMPVSSCLFDGCTQLEIKWFVCPWILKASLKILWL